MSLRDEANIIKNYNKNLKKSIHSTNRNDIFLVVAILIMAVTPLVIWFFYNYFIKESEPGEILLLVSAQSEELFGKELMENLIKEYEEKKHGIRIYTVHDARSSNAALQTEPDIYFFDEGEISFLSGAGLLAELNSYTNFDSGARQTAIPLVSYMDLFFYNIDVLTAAGVISPPKTRDEFLAGARAVAGSNSGASALAVSLSRDDRRALSRDIFSWMLASGNYVWSEDGRPSFNTRLAVNDFTFFGALYREGLLAPGVFNTTGDQRIEQFAQGRIAMMIASSREIPYLRERMGDSRFGITTIPDVVTGERYSAGISAIYAGMSANTRHPQEAWEFLVFLAEKSPFLCAELKAIPGIAAKIIPGDYINDDPFYSKAWGIFEFAYIAESFADKPGADEYYDVFLDELEIFFDSGRTSQQAVTAIQQRWNDIFDGK